MAALRALVTAAAWWVASMLVTRSAGAASGLGLACVVAGALSGAVVRAAVLSLVLGVIGVAVDPSLWTTATSALHGRGPHGASGLLAAWAPFAVPFGLGMLAAIVAKRASASGVGPRHEVEPSSEGVGWFGGLVATRPDLVIRVRELRKDWSGLAQLAESLGMPRSAARWWRAAGEPERARNISTSGAAVDLEVVERPGRHGRRDEPSPRLELEDPRPARSSIDPHDDET